MGGVIYPPTLQNGRKTAKNTVKMNNTEIIQRQYDRQVARTAKAYAALTGCTAQELAHVARIATAAADVIWDAHPDTPADTLTRMDTHAIMGADGFFGDELDELNPDVDEICAVDMAQCVLPLDARTETANALNVDAVYLLNGVIPAVYMQTDNRPSDRPTRHTDDRIFIQTSHFPTGQQNIYNI